MHSRAGSEPAGTTHRTTYSAALALVPARGGSKGIHRKNLVLLGGHPLVAWSIAAARQARTVGRIVVSTDDEEIAEIALAYGAEVPFMRPAELAADDTPDLPVFVHALEWLSTNQGYEPDLVVHLRPTTPFRRASEIDAAVLLLQDRPEIDSARSVIEPFQTPFKMWRYNSQGLLEPLLRSSEGEVFNMPRQGLPSVFWHNGYIDVVRRRTILSMRSMTGARIAPLRGLCCEWADIDTRDMLDYAEFLLSHGRPDCSVPSNLEGRGESAADDGSSIAGLRMDSADLGIVRG